MPEPISSSAATAAAGGLAFLSLIPGLDPAAVLGAVAGALIFINTVDQLSNWRRGGLFLASVLIGLLAADITATLLSTVLPQVFNVTNALGAILASAMSVHLLQGLLRKSPDDLIDLIRRKGG
ncbi:putative holin [Aeromonas sp. AE23HZ002T15]